MTLKSTWEKPAHRSMGILPVSRRAVPRLRGNKLWPCTLFSFHGRGAHETTGKMPVLVFIHLR